MKKQLFILTTTLLSLSGFAQNLILEDTIIACGSNNIILTSPNPSIMNVWTKDGEQENIIAPAMNVQSSGWYHLYSATSGINDVPLCMTFDLSNNWTGLINVPEGYMITDVQLAWWGTPNTNCANPTVSSCQLDVKTIVERGLLGRRNFQYFGGSFPDPCSGVYKSLFLKLLCSPFVHDSVYVAILPSLNLTPLSDATICDGEFISMSAPLITCDTNYITIDSLTLPSNNTIINSIALIQGREYRLKVKNAISFGGGSGNQFDGAYGNYPSLPAPNIRWRINGSEYGALNDFRPEPDGYNPSHEYSFYLLGDGNPLDLGAFDCCLGDNSGYYTFILQEIVKSEGCEMNYIWSNGTMGNSAIYSSSNSPEYLYISDGFVQCPLDTFYVYSGNSSSTLTETALDFYILNGQTYTQSGTYTQIIPNATGCDSTITLNLSLDFTGLQEFENSFTISPNPAKDQLNVLSPSGISENYFLLDEQGRIVLTGKLTGTTTTIDISKLAAGNYLLQVGEEQMPVRIVKN
jgi:hypothetical protein